MTTPGETAIDAVQGRAAVPSTKSCWHCPRWRPVRRRKRRPKEFKGVRKER
jgi:hypothetical protein